MKKSYWNGTGKYQEVFNLPIIPQEYRKAFVIYYDLHNNGLCNYSDEFESVFGFAPNVQDIFNKDFLKKVEHKMDKICKKVKGI